MLAAWESFRVPLSKERMLLVAHLLLGPSLPNSFWASCWTKSDPSPSRLGVGCGADTPLPKPQLFWNPGNERALAQRRAERQRRRRRKKYYSEDSSSISHRNVCNCLPSVQFAVIQIDNMDITWVKTGHLQAEVPVCLYFPCVVQLMPKYMHHSL